MDIQILNKPIKLVGLLQLVLSCLFVCCMGGCAKDVIFDNPPSHDLYFEATMDGNSGLTIHVSPVVSLHQANNVPPVWIDDLVILLFEEGELIDTVQYADNGLYKSSAHFIPHPGKEYHFATSHASYNSAISNRIRMLSEPDFRDFNLVPYRDGYRLSGDLYAGMEDEYYWIDPVFIAEDNSLGFSNTIEHLNLNTSFEIDGGCGWNHQIVTNFCHKNTSIPLDMYLGPPSFIFSTAVEIRIMISSISESYFSDLQSYQFPTDATEAFALGINVQQNFFEKGLGVFYILHSQEYVIPL